MQSEDLITGIIRHLTYIDKVNDLSLLMLRNALSGDTESIARNAENRTRLINNVEKLQNYVEDKINLLSKDQATNEVLDILRSWVGDVSNWVAFTDEIDAEMTEVLENLKEQTTKEIGNLYRSRSQFKGYNLNNVKK